MVYTDEQVRAMQQEIQGAAGMLPQQQPKKPDANAQWQNYIGGMIDQQIQQNTPVSQQFNLFKQNQAVQQQAQQPQLVVQQTPQKVVTKPQPVVDPNSATSGMDAVIANMYTSPEQEEKMRKASVANQRILALGDALRHIGNIYHTVNYAPSQQFNKPWEEEQARYEKGKAVRDAANARYLSYQQQKAAQDAKQKQWEMQFRYNAAKDARDYELKKGESEARNNLREAQLNRYQTLIALDEARRDGIISDNEYKKRRAELYPEEVRSRIAKNNRTGGGRSGGGRGGSNMPDYDVETTYERDEEGRVKSQKKTRRVKHRDGTTSTNTKTTQPKQTQKKALPGQAPAQPKKRAKKRLPGT